MTVLNKKGFTLIELLIVIAILGTLAVVVLLALNPVQQLARTRDAGRQSTITQLGHAMEAFATVRGGVYPDAGGAGDCDVGETAGEAWITNCLQGGEIQAVPSNPTYSASAGVDCAAAASDEDDLCYNSAGGTSAVIYTAAEADSNLDLCPDTQQAYFVYASLAGRGGVWCGAGGAQPPANLDDGSTGWVNF